MYYIISNGIGVFLLSTGWMWFFVAHDLQSESKSTHLGSNWAKLKFKMCTFLEYITVKPL